MRVSSPLPRSLYLRLLGGVMASLVGLAAAINWAVDPLQVFRRATAYSPRFSENQRYQSPGLARHYTQPIIVVGTSHMENMLPTLVAKALGQPALNLAIAGSSLREQQLALSLALASGKVRRVLWGIDYSALTWGDILVEEWGEFPDYLYSLDIRLVSRYLLSSQTLMESTRAITQAPTLTLDERNTWWHSHTFNRDRVLAAWRHESATWTPAMRETVRDKISWPMLREVLERRVFATIRAHPEIRFDLILPPYSLLIYANDFRIHDEYFFQRLLMREALRQFSSKQANVRLHDFQTDLPIVSDLNHYKDLEHYGLPINLRMLAALATDMQSTEIRDPLVGQVRHFLSQSCGEQTAEQRELCPPLVQCGLRRLSNWMDDGGNLEHALLAAHAPCQ